MAACSNPSMLRNPVRAMLASCWPPRATTNKPLPPTVPAAKPFVLTNDSSWPVQVWKNGNGPVAIVPPGTALNVDPERHGGVPRPGGDYFEGKMVAAGVNVVVAAWRGGAPAIRVTDADAKRPDALLRLQATAFPSRARARARERVRARVRAATAVAALLRGAAARRPVECPICIETVPVCALVRPARACAAKHAACGPCARRYLDLAIADGRLIVACPGVACATLLTTRDVEEVAGALRLARLKESVVEANQRRLVDLSKGGGDDRTFAAWAGANARACPVCRVIIYRYAGCDRMACRCGAIFSWASPAASVTAVRGAGDLDRWCCGTCTFANHEAMARCEVCRAARPPRPDW